MSFYNAFLQHAAALPRQPKLGPPGLHQMGGPMGDGDPYGRPPPHILLDPTVPPGPGPGTAGLPPPGVGPLPTYDGGPNLPNAGNLGLDYRAMGIDPIANYWRGAGGAAGAQAYWNAAPADFHARYQDMFTALMQILNGHGPQAQ